MAELHFGDAKLAYHQLVAKQQFACLFSPCVETEFLPFLIVSVSAARFAATAGAHTLDGNMCIWYIIPPNQRPSNIQQLRHENIIHNIFERIYYEIYI